MNDETTTATGARVIVRERDVEPPPSQQVDPLLYRMVVGFLGAAIMLTIVLVALLSFTDHGGADSLIALGGAATGGLVGLLAPSPVQR